MKPALVGLLGPWVSGGIEFNWPQHHRPTTFMAVDHIISENTDGAFRYCAMIQTEYTEQRESVRSHFIRIQLI